MDSHADTSRYVRQLETRIDEKDEVIGLLKGQLVAKDQQITDLSTRFGNLSDRFADTQKLLGAMQRMRCSNGHCMRRALRFDILVSVSATSNCVARLVDSDGKQLIRSEPN